MWTRDASHVASAALGAYAFSEIAARVVGDAVEPDTTRWLTLVALAVVASAFALVARADARAARARTQPRPSDARAVTRASARPCSSARRAATPRGTPRMRRAWTASPRWRASWTWAFPSATAARARRTLTRLASAAGDAREARGGARVRREGKRGAENPEG